MFLFVFSFSLCFIMYLSQFDIIFKQTVCTCAANAECSICNFGLYEEKGRFVIKWWRFLPTPSFWFYPLPKLLKLLSPYFCSYLKRGNFSWIELWPVENGPLQGIGPSLLLFSEKRILYNFIELKLGKYHSIMYLGQLQKGYLSFLLLSFKVHSY